MFKAFLDEQSERNIPRFMCAVKIIRDGYPDALQELTEEATLMADFNHRNVMSLIGVVTRGTPKMIILPFCSNGDLHGFLRCMKGALNLRVRSQLAGMNACTQKDNMA